MPVAPVLSVDCAIYGYIFCLNLIGMQINPVFYFSFEPVSRMGDFMRTTVHLSAVASYSGRLIIGNCKSVSMALIFKDYGGY